MVNALTPFVFVCVTTVFRDWKTVDKIFEKQLITVHKSIHDLVRFGRTSIKGFLSNDKDMYGTVDLMDAYSSLVGIPCP